MTEDEARKKTCPLTFAISQETRGDGLTIRYAGPHDCIGSDCMAWRRQGGETHYKPLEGQVEHGFCGLAGKP